MIIHKPKIKKKGNFYYLSSDIEVEKNNSLSTNIWYKFPLDQKNFISESSDCFVVGMIFLAMKLNENITVEGKMSPKLAYSLKQFQGYFHSWYPEDFHIVKIFCKNLIEDLKEKNAVVSSFSGGIDSFYTLACHMNTKEKKDKITHSLYIRGFDMALDNDSNELVKDRYEKFLKILGIKLLKADTNLKLYLDKEISQAKTFGAVLTSVFLALSNEISKVYLASAYQYHDLLPFPNAAAIADGSNPVTDNLFSLENTIIFHHDSSISRIEKTIGVSKWPMTYNNLRVCWYPEGMKNCCLCSKCMRTMLALNLIGELEKYQGSFEILLDRGTMSRWIIEFDKDMGFIRELIKFARNKGRYDVVLQLLYMIFKTYLRNITLVKDTQDYFYTASFNLKQISPIYKRLIYKIKKT